MKSIYPSGKPKAFRFSDDQAEYLEKIKRIIYKKTDIKVTITWIVKKMMSFGQEKFHKDFGISFEAIDKINIEE